MIRNYYIIFNMDIGIYFSQILYSQQGAAGTNYNISRSIRTVIVCNCCWSDD